MNTALFIRHIIELAMIVPAGIMSVIPVRNYQKVKTNYLITLFTVIMITAVLGGSVVCSVYHIPSNMALLVFMPVFFLAYHFCYQISLSKKFFCFLYASMLCGFCTMYSTFATAPLELDNHDGVFHISSGLICLGITLAIGAVFFRTLSRKITEMLDNPALDKLWIRLMFVPFLMTIILIWMTPISPENAMVGRLRPVSMVILLLIPMTLWFMCHMMWWITNRMTETAQLQQNYDILQMEEKQYRSTLRYLEETRTLRHDFRHHLLMIEELAEKNETEKLLEYIRPFIQKTENTNQKKYFQNPVLNAVASHYIELAKEQDTLLMWGIDLPEKIPFKESDICSVLGNLLENAINAVRELPKEQRIIHSTISFQNGMTFAVHMSNEYKGHIVLDKNGLPEVNAEHHGIGLRSVQNTVNRYNGMFAIETNDGRFDIYVVMYSAEKDK